jgi:hypothetical protein
MDRENHDASGIGSGVTESDSSRKEIVEFILDYLIFTQVLSTRICLRLCIGQGTNIDLGYCNIFHPSINTRSIFPASRHRTRSSSNVILGEFFSRLHHLISR